jgi:hypothetical protein
METENKSYRGILVQTIVKHLKEKQLIIFGMIGIVLIV